MWSYNVIKDDNGPTQASVAVLEAAQVYCNQNCVLHLLSINNIPSSSVSAGAKLTLPVLSAEHSHRY